MGLVCQLQDSDTHVLGVHMVGGATGVRGRSEGRGRW